MIGSRDYEWWVTRCCAVHENNQKISLGMYRFVGSLQHLSLEFTLIKNHWHYPLPTQCRCPCPKINHISINSIDYKQATRNASQQTCKDLLFGFNVTNSVKYISCGTGAISASGRPSWALQASIMDNVECMLLMCGTVSTPSNHRGQRQVYAYHVLWFSVLICWHCTYRQSPITSLNPQAGVCNLHKLCRNNTAMLHLKPLITHIHTRC